MSSIKKVRRKIIRLVVTGTLAGAQGALAGVVVHDVDWGEFSRGRDVVRSQSLPRDVRGGSIRLDEEHDATGLNVPVGLVSAEAAAQTAAGIGSSEVLSAELEIENGYLVWAVEIRDAEGTPGTVMVDAGTGRLLAFDTG
jgi:uncharacterized membrane protein YkoI